MSIKLMTAVWENKTGNLTKDETSYLVKLCDSAADNGTQVWPSRKVLVQKTRISESTQKRLDKSLTEKGYLEVISRERPNGSRTSNEYRINANKLLVDAGMEPLLEEDTPPVSVNPPPVSVNPPPGQCDRPYKQEIKQEVKQENNADQDDPRFVQFRKEYPGKGSTKKEIAKALKAALKKTTIEEIIQAIRRQKAERATLKAGKFVPAWKYPATWLNKECWTDEPLGSANDTQELRSTQADRHFIGAI